MDTFSDVLAREIERSGLSLERLHRRLAARGVVVGVSTLSYWRRGICQPERAESLRALGVLERELDLTAGTLTALIGPRKPRGRWLGRLRVHAPESLWPETAGLARALAELGGSQPWDVDVLRVRDHHRLDADGRAYATHVRQLVRAEADGVRSCVVVHAADDHAAPTLTAGPECAVGAVRRLTGVTAAELVLDRTLKAAETAVLSYVVEWGSRQRAVRYGRRMLRSPREYLLQVDFPADPGPVECHAFVQRDAGSPEQSRGVLRIGRYSGAHSFFTDCEPIMGVRWRW
ncbi:hypothetical protein GCM10023148_43430 [Actinokineospora soli]